MRWLAVLLLFATVAHAAALSARDAYVPATPPGQTMGAMFLTIDNPTDRACTLVSARSELATRVELHTHVHHDGQMRMQALPELEIPAHGRAVLQPGGLHLMLFGLKRPLRAGDQVPFSLSFADGSRLDAVAGVRDLRR